MTDCDVWPEESAELPAASELSDSSEHSASVGTQPCPPVADSSFVDIDARPHKCPHCDKGFVKAWGLQKHCRVHTKERPYKCRYCPKSFSERKFLNIHEHRHTGGKPYLCLGCCMAFTCESTFTKHMQQHH
ncbi:hypothetical protein HPB51_004817 [Rhipicephalus microplus]|uniref:C2H2-type domain-containing protein n=1 Tax=Rhipicephalus microplus TaxID=6941 RepID=A0A9J6E668_RHIMP|nr:zinc finger protein 362-like [Rhipicephalus microplus]KAH8029812.1 hypothetical protein HPB51_004817 [Rhipicephalus microplus]